MKRWLTIAVVLLGGWPLTAGPAAGQLLSVPKDLGSNAADWPTERVEMLDGREYRGLIESEDEVWIRMILITRLPGRPMYLVIRPIERASVAKVVRLQREERAELRRRIDRFVNRARIEAARMEAIDLGLVTRHRTHYRRYRGKWFTLESTADEPITRRIIVRAEQIFTAYRQVLPPRADPGRPLRVVVLGSMDEYHAYLARLGVRINSRACFIPDDNLVVAASELARFAAQLAENRAYHDRLRAELKELQKRLQRRLSEVSEQLQRQGLPREQITKLLTIERAKFERQMEQKQRELARCHRESARAFDAVTRQMFTRLYHEAFHAYLENHVYPQQDHHVPRWLNEGLAVICEGGLLESDRLRIDAPNRAALARLKSDLNSEQPLPLEKLLAAGQEAFVAGEDAARYYVYAWGLVYYLAFEKRMLGGSGLDGYVQPSAEGTSPIERFEKLVGVPLSEFEKAWGEYVFKLH